MAFVHIPLLMDGEAGNGQQVTVQMDQAPLYTGGRLHHGAPGHGERAVQPRGAVHAAVALHLQTNVTFVSGHRVAFDAEGGGVAVGGSHAPAGQGGGRETEGDETALIPGDVIGAALLQPPLAGLLQSDKSGLFQQRGGATDRVKRAGAFFNIRHKARQCIHDKTS